ncbi:HAD family hydrolase [Synechococcus sp. RSCCF101]|uniref:HAD family hydrolase n=1 Tax=Synechococcus sp. RSCCF101 TaxID=2511069 RepID=UPI001244F867|nr:HAD family hydrolase [Synechococcus sp. RSCCF101]QEY32167.1 HAD family hydrolase [Synechococcus sp. RSCCF101]
MASRPTLVFDFDGVLIDGMEEYWWSARTAALALRPALALALPEAVPAAFRRLRPRVHKGWEMVLLALLLAGDSEGQAPELAPGDDWSLRLLPAWAGSPEPLQRSLESAREQAIATDLDAWLGRHHAFEGVVPRLRALEDAGLEWGVLTTKAERFTRRILDAQQLRPAWVIGHERGSKVEVLRSLLLERPRALWFVEDRRATLEQVLAEPDLAGAVRCYLATWGYLGPGDATGLPAGIRLLSPAAFSAGLADWP